MLQELRNYVKCVFGNKVVLAGYAGLGLCAFIKYIEYKTGVQIPLINDAFCMLSLGLLGVTSFGKGTYEAYNRMKKHIETHGTIENSFKNKFGQEPCVQVGIRMAAKEKGLEKLI